MKHPEISVVIPCFKEGKLLQETIESVLKQTFSDFEILLIDNNCSPDTRTIIDYYVNNYPQTIRTLKESIPGPSFARNTGIIESHGSFIALLDGDDLMYPKRLERQYQAIQNNPEVALVACGIDFFKTGDSPDNKTITSHNVIGGLGQDWKERTNYLRKFFSKFPKHSNPNSFFFTLPSTMFFHRNTAIKAGLFSLDIASTYNEDLEFCTRMIEEGPFLMIPEPLAAYRNLSPTSGSYQFRNSPEGILKKCISDYTFLSILYKRHIEIMKDVQPIFRQICSNYLRNAGSEFMQFSHGAEIGKVLLRRAFLMDPRNVSGWKLIIKSLMPKIIFPKLFWFKEFSIQSFPIGLDRSFSYTLFSLPPNQNFIREHAIQHNRSPASSTISSENISEKPHNTTSSTVM
ncbi:MAG: glycosyltransferase family 2 protein [Leptospirales bacterium]